VSLAEHRETVHCAYDGVAGAGAAPLTWAQRFMWEVIRAAGTGCAGFDFVLSRELPAPDGRSAAIEVLRAFLLRHPVLRTAVVVGADGIPVQHVRAAGSIPVVVRREPLGPARLRDAVPGCTETDPVRALLLVDPDGGARLALRISHLATDGWGIRVLAEDLQAPAGTGRTTASPLDVARFEASPDGVAVQRRSIAHAASVYAACPPTMWPGRRRHPEPDRFWYGELRSSALRAALEELRQRRRVHRAGALTGALAAVAAAAAGLDSALLFMISSNRFDERWRRYPGQLSQEAILHVPVRPTVTGTMRAGVVETMRALRAARYSPGQLRLTARAAAAQRGVRFDGLGSAVVLNLLGDEPTRRERAVSPGPSTFRWTRTTAVENLGFFLDVFETGEEVVLAARFDTARLDPAAAQRWLRTIEWAVVTAAARDLSTAELCERLRTGGAAAGGADRVQP
jgi:hypothetical protein